MPRCIPISTLLSAFHPNYHCLLSRNHCLLHWVLSFCLSHHHPNQAVFHTASCLPKKKLPLLCESLHLVSSVSLMSSSPHQSFAFVCQNKKLQCPVLPGFITLRVFPPCHSHFLEYLPWAPFLVLLMNSYLSLHTEPKLHCPNTVTLPYPMVDVCLSSFALIDLWASWEQFDHLCYSSPLGNNIKNTFFFSLFPPNILM